jgi:hypothetical protein
MATFPSGKIPSSLNLQLITAFFVPENAFNLNAFIFAREHLRFLVALKYFLRDFVFLVPAVIIRFILIREPIGNPHGCAFAVIFTFGLLLSVFFGKGYSGIASGIGTCLVIFGWYQILLMRRKY